jgi:hypothetical protein
LYFYQYTFARAEMTGFNMFAPTCVVAAVALLPGFASAGFTINNGITLPPMGWSALYGAPFGKVNETIVSFHLSWHNLWRNIDWGGAGVHSWVGRGKRHKWWLRLVTTRKSAIQRR